jgi:hypothetical protein
MEAEQVDVVHCCNCFANHADYGQGVCANCKNHDIIRQRLWACGECGKLHEYEEQAEDCCVEGFKSFDALVQAIEDYALDPNGMGYLKHGSSNDEARRILSFSYDLLQVVQEASNEESDFPNEATHWARRFLGRARVRNGK